MNKYNITSVAYLNSLPFIHGIQHSGLLNDSAELSLDIPSDCAKKLAANEVDIALLPVGAFADNNTYNIIGKYCIGAVGPLKSVLLVSKVPLQKITTIVYDNHSRTSNLLTKVLAEKYWKINTNWETQNQPNYKKDIVGTKAHIVIGDKALKIMNDYEYIYDLAFEWQKYTSLPFVFACWTANKNIPESFITKFEAALQYGIENIDIIVKKNKVSLNFDLKDYLTNYINYNLDDKKIKAMNLFLELTKK